MANKNSVSQSFSLPVKLVDRIAARALQTGETRSQVVQSALTYYLDVNEAQSVETCAGCAHDAPPTFSDCMECLVRSLNNGGATNV
jgi:metal-responsive CopG/Arc/MetJ family transcriptional regulator